MSVTYIGAFCKSGCTIDGADEGEANLSTLFPFSKTVYEIAKPEEENRRLRHLDTVTDFCTRLKETIQACKADFPVTVGGDHALAIGSISASYQPDMALIWIDAHGDSNTDSTTISGRIHGMPVSVLQGLGSETLTAVCAHQYLDPRNILFYGIRSLDPLEALLMRNRHMKVIETADVQKKGNVRCTSEAIDYLKGKKLYISCDLDSINPEACHGVNTPVSDGLTVEDVLQLLDALFSKCEVIGMDLVEYNPRNDQGETYEIIRQIRDLIEKHKGGSDEAIHSGD